ncbi:MAG: hypothetical protein QXD48_02430 [Candidatus Aenigmatarchaeota archaeon]
MKGVNIFLSAVLLILLTVVIASFVFNWITTLSTERSESIKNTTKERLGCQFADMYIINATYDCNGDCSSGIIHRVNVSISNSGKKALEISRIVIQNTTGSIFNYNINETKILSVGETLTITNVSTDTCDGINKTIEKIIVSSNNCPNQAFDSIPGKDVIFINC